MDKEVAKQLKVKFGSLKRNYKEYFSYQKEAEKQQEKVNKLKAEQIADEYDVKKQEEVLQETQQMLPGCKSRIQASLEDLKKFMEEIDSQGAPESKEAQDFKDSETLIKEVEEFISSN